VATLAILACCVSPALAQAPACGPPGSSRKVVVNKFDFANPDIGVVTSDISFAKACPPPPPPAPRTRPFPMLPP
jgi:hypothetical protein